VILFQLWLGSLPAALKALFEQTFRPGFAFAAARVEWLARMRTLGAKAR
jgi:putative NADPH-quinone reductase